ncbi:PopZ family protein [Nitratireductor sp. CH_MIT9313-5]|uniref:PopZ family protein n=1 Tax=Nitratireductor sp. CH_MIT9313-5 TaxID=3107764 RepID=UPI00300B6B43
MAQASSVQREPSMEEILASIRRIIEDNEAGAGAGVAASSAANVQAAAAAQPETGPDAVEEFRAELRPSLSDTQPQAETKSAPADEDKVHALNPYRDAGEQKPFEWSGSAKAASADTATPAQGMRAWPPAGRRDEDDTQQDASVVREDEPELKQVDEPAEQQPASSTQTASVSQNVEQVVRESLSEATGRELAAERKPILSEQSGRKVAAAFSELNEAFQASRRKGLDEVAEEMLRPMLQEWLDDNLPTIVERLVREEIERVARGG